MTIDTMRMVLIAEPDAMRIQSIVMVRAAHAVLFHRLTTFPKKTKKIQWANARKGSR